MKSKCSCLADTLLIFWLKKWRQLLQNKKEVNFSNQKYEQNQLRVKNSDSKLESTSERENKQRLVITF